MFKIKKKIVRLCFFLLFLLILSAILFKNFTKEEINYQRSEWQVKEIYNKEEKYYTWSFTKDNMTINYALNSSRKLKRKQIKKIDVYSTSDATCLKVIAKNIEVPYLCLNGNEEVSVNLVDKEMKDILNIDEDAKENEIASYNNTSIYSYNNHLYYLWNYKGFNVISSEENKEINLFTKETYSPTLITKINNKLVIPDYDSSYSFSKFYIIDMQSMQVSKWNLKEAIYFDSSILGIKDDTIYLIDKHEEKEWALNIKKKTASVVSSSRNGGIFYQNGFQKVTLNKLLYQDDKFINDNIVSYSLENNIMYKTFKDKKVKVLNIKDAKIVSFYNDDVFYLIKDSLYEFDGVDNKKILSNFEWHFNNDNLIFITD